MEIKSLLARYMFKRMSHYWTQAAANKPYTPSLISFLEQSPRPFSAEMRRNVRAMKNALEELIKRQVVSHYTATNQTDGKKIVNVSYEIYPHSKVYYGNYQSQRNREKGKSKYWFGEGY